VESDFSLRNGLRSDCDIDFSAFFEDGLDFCFLLRSAIVLKKRKDGGEKRKLIKY
jgi:hypothetical protein